MAKKRHNKDKKLHNFSEKLHNSDAVNEEPDLSWQERVDLVPEDEVESGSEIYYFTDEDGNIHSREFLVEELIPDIVEDREDSLKSRYERVQRLKPGSVEIVNLVPTSGETQREISVPVPKSGTAPLDIRISSEVVPDLYTKKESQSRGVEEFRQVIVNLEDRSTAGESTRTVNDRNDRTPLVLNFTQTELESYVTYRSEGLAEKSKDWITRSSDAVWESTRGEISHQTMTRLRTFVLEKYNSTDSHSKVLSFAKSFLKLLATTRSEPRYQTFAPYLELPKAVKERKSVTSRIVTREDINNVLQHIERAERGGAISPERSAQYSAFVLFGAYTGQRSEATTAKLTVGQFREALDVDKPVLQVDSSQDKIRMSHYVPLHPRVVEALKPLLVGRDDGELMFTYNSFIMWIKRQKIPMSRFNGHFALGDLRKFAEQHGDVIQWDQSNRAYILTHGVSGVDWKHYKHPLPEDVYDIYLHSWGDVDLRS